MWDLWPYSTCYMESHKSTIMKHFCCCYSFCPCWYSYKKMQLNTTPFLRAFVLFSHSSSFIYMLLAYFVTKGEWYFLEIRIITKIIFCCIDFGKKIICIRLFNSKLFHIAAAILNFKPAKVDKQVVLCDGIEMQSPKQKIITNPAIVGG